MKEGSNQNLTICNWLVRCYINMNNMRKIDRAGYATFGMENQLFVSKYLTQLPDKKVLGIFFKREIGE